MAQDPEQIREQIEQTRGEMGDTVEAITHKTDVPGRMKESIANKRDRLKRQMAGASSTVSERTPDADDVRQGAQQAVGIAQENPLGLAIGGIAVGFLVGMALPKTRAEDERIGPLADQVKDSAAGTAQEALERGKTVAQEAAGAAVETARETGSEQAQELRDSAQEQASEIRS